LPDEDCGAKSTINLVAVDGKRIGRFATYAFHLVLAPLRLIIASVMLMNILGWQSLAAGLGCIAISNHLSSSAENLIWRIACSTSVRIDILLSRTVINHLVLAPLRLIIASVMLMNILGWQSLAAGLGCIA
jgi:hypothetical protein